MSDFDRALAFVFKWEGLSVDDPDDLGGRTNFGITQGTYDDWADRRKLPREDVWKIRRELARRVYEEVFWWVGKDHPWPLNLVLFDVAVHHGAPRATEWLAKVSWLEAAPEEQAWAILCYRRDFMRALVVRKPSQAKWLKGWLNRVDDLARVAGLAPGRQAGSAKPQPVTGQEPAGLPKLDVASSTLVARSSSTTPDSRT